MSEIWNTFDDEDEENDIDNNSEKYLTFFIDKQYYAYSIKDVKEIIEIQEITPVPEFPDYAKGVINLRGTVIPVIDVRLRFNKDSVPYNERTCIIILNIKDIEVGFVVDTVDEVMNIEKSNIVPVPKLKADGNTRRFIDNMGKAENKIIMLLNAEKMLTDDEIEAYGEVYEPAE